MIETIIQLGRPLWGVALADPHAPLAAASPLGDHTGSSTGAPLADDRQHHDERERFRRVLDGLTEATRSLHDQERAGLAEMQQAAVELAVAIASHLIHDKIEKGDFAVETLVRKAVQRLGAKQLVTVCLHPDDIALLERRVGGDTVLFGSTAEIRLVPDRSLGRGDCRAEAGEVKVLAQVEAQLAGIRRHLLRSLVHAEPEPGQAEPGNRELRPVSDRRQSA